MFALLPGLVLGGHAGGDDDAAGVLSQPRTDGLPGGRGAGGRSCLAAFCEHVRSAHGARGGLVLVDGYALFFTGLLMAAAMAVVLLSYAYLQRRASMPEEFHILLLLSTLGATILVVSNHFATFFLGLEC